MKNRRKLVVALGASSLLASFGSLAQTPGKVWRVGFLTLRGRPDNFDSNVFGAFREGMRELGYVEGKNLIIEWRFADGKPERLAGPATELVQLNVDVIITAASQPTGAAQKATGTAGWLAISFGRERQVAVQDHEVKRTSNKLQLASQPGSLRETHPTSVYVSG